MRVVYCSCPQKQAGELARKVVEARLVACAQVIPVIESYYWWEGKVCCDDEALLVLKTDASVIDPLTSFLRENHPYTVPEVVSLTILPDEGNPDYLSWLQREVKGDGST